MGDETALVSYYVKIGGFSLSDKDKSLTCNLMTLLRTKISPFEKRKLKRKCLKCVHPKHKRSQTTTTNPLICAANVLPKEKERKICFLPVPDSFHRSCQEYCLNQPIS